VCVCPFFRGYCKDKAQLKLTRRNISIKEMLKEPGVPKLKARNEKQEGNSP
jgi:hypothetical protein